MADELDEMIAQEAARQAAEDGTTVENEEENTDNLENTEEGEEKGTPPPAAAAAPNGEPEKAPESKAATTESNPEGFDVALERLSNGRFKTSAELSDAIAKLGEFDNLSKEAETLRQQVLTAPKFADEFEQKRNELKLSGASKETLRTFEKLNDLGDLSTLDPLEAKVMKLVLVDGVSEKIARLKVEREFPQDDDLEGDDLEIYQFDLRQAAKEDLKALEAFKVQVSTPVQSDNKLLDEAGKLALTESLKPALATFTASIDKLTSIELGVDKEGVPALTHDITLTEPDKQFLADRIKGYMIENGLPLTQENFKEAQVVASQEFVAANLPKISNAIWKAADAHYNKLYTEKYENPGGKPKGETQPKNATSAQTAERIAMEESLLGGKFK